MYLYCSNCRKYIEAQEFPRIIDINIIIKEHYCPYCLETIYIKCKEAE